MKHNRNSGPWILIAMFIVISADTASADEATDQNKPPRAGAAAAHPAESSAKAALKNSGGLDQDDVDKSFFVVKGLLRFLEFEDGVGLKQASCSPKDGCTAPSFLGKTPAKDLKFAVVQNAPIGSDGKVSRTSSDIYYVIKVFEITRDPFKGDSVTINSDDNKKLFAMQKTIFDQAVSDGYIAKRYSIGWRGVDVGPSISLPLKLRRRIDDNGKYNGFDITDEVSIGGYLALQWRISEAHPIFVKPLVSAGVSLLPISDPMSSDPKAKATNKVPGLTLAAGAVVQFERYQLGLMLGVDYASGALGAAWSYNGKPWVSFALGFNFFKPED